MKHYIIAGVFWFFAAAQCMDPNPWGWIIIFLATGGLAIVTARQLPYRRLFAGILGLISIIWLLVLLPGLVDWLAQGAPSLVAHRKAETHFIELTREFLGLAFVVGTSVYYSQKS